MKKSGATPIDAIGQRFDPNFHEALYQEERGDMDADTVVAEIQKGYILNDRLIRPSRVGVSKKPEIQ
ncbi:MAG TPA: nucleotide exchange factor GrpE [Syntrophorhabdaceae bacterium]|nr:nucleotide exchange factor GrpE [Syntrophorhabdaceae bacterium]